MRVLSLSTKAGMVLLPVSMVAQIVSISNAIPINHRQKYVSSIVRWREFDVPVVQSSRVFSDGELTDEFPTRAVIVWPMEGYQRHDLFALSSTAAPRVILVNESASLVSSKASPYAMGVIEIGEETAIIPDLSAISKDVFGIK